MKSVNQAPSITSIRVNTRMSGFITPATCTLSPSGCRNFFTKVSVTSANSTPPPMAIRAMLQSDWKLASTTANTHQAATSSSEPAAKASVPIEVLLRPCSKMMRASIGKAVIDMAAPMNRMASRLDVFSANSCGSSAMKYAKVPPSRKGAMMPAAEMLAALFRRLRIISTSNSTPIRNMYSTRPSCATENRIGLDSAGNR